MLSKMGDKSLVVIPKHLVDADMLTYRDRRLRITVILEEIKAN